MKKKMMFIVFILTYTLLVTQVALATRPPEVKLIKEVEYIEVEVPIIKEVEVPTPIKVQQGKDNIVQAEKPKKEWLRDVKLSEELQKYTYDLCQEYNISYDLIIAIMYLESRFNPKAINNTNTNNTTDQGLMQINSCNWEWVDELAGRDLDLNKPKDNILAGILIFDNFRTYWINKGYTSQEELFTLTLLSYNRGAYGASKYIENNSPYDNSYVDKVLEYKNMIEINNGFKE